jgi:hypothetical protein
MDTAERQFDAWLARWKGDRETRRTARRIELETALRNGSKVRQVYGDGEAAASIWPDCSPFVAELNTPANLARHIERREDGFGFETEILARPRRMVKTAHGTFPVTAH